MTEPTRLSDQPQPEDESRFAGEPRLSDAQSARRDELAQRLRELHQRVDAAAGAAGRDPSEITSIIVTKTFPASDIALLAGLGVREIGEARVDEARDKAVELGPVAGDLVWHAIGRLQTNKTGVLLRWADVVQSLDRVKLVSAIERAAASAGRRVRALVQVSLDGDPERGGAPLEQVPRVAEAILAADHLDLAGVMAVAPLGRDPAAAFELLAEVAEQVRTLEPAAQMISAGMSGDLEAAVARGATHLRVGTAVLGSRPLLK